MSKRKVLFVLWGGIKYDGRVQKEIRSLINAGFHVVLLLSNFGDDNISNYDYEIIDLKTKSYRNPIRNIFLYNTFYKKAIPYINKIQPDIIHCNDLNTLYLGMYFKKKNPAKKVVYDAHELYPESQKDFIRRTLWTIKEKIYIKYCDNLIVPEENRGKFIQKKYSLKNDFFLIPNYPYNNDESINKNYLEELFPESIGKKKVFYIGGIGKTRSISEILYSINKLDNKFCFIVIGPFDKGYRKEFDEIVNKNQLKERIFLGNPVPNNMVLKLIASADIGILFYRKNNLNNYYCAPNKLYEFLLFNKPVVTNNYPGLKKIVEEKNKGVCINNLNPDTIAQSIEQASKLIILKETDKFTWNSIEDKFISIYAK